MHRDHEIDGAAVETIDNPTLAGTDRQPHRCAGGGNQIARQADRFGPSPRIRRDAPEIRHHRLDHVDDLAHFREKIARVDVIEGQAVPMRAQQIHQGKAVLAAAEVEGSAPVAIEGRHQKNANADAARVTAGPMYWPAPSPPPPLVLDPCWVPLPSVWPPGNMLW